MKPAKAPAASTHVIVAPMEIMASTGTSALRVTKTSTKYEITYTCMHTNIPACRRAKRSTYVHMQHAHAQADMPMARACMYVCITSCTWRTSAMIMFWIAFFLILALDEQNSALGALGQGTIERHAASGQKRATLSSIVVGGRCKRLRENAASFGEL